MIDKKLFLKIHKESEAFDKARERIIQTSRKALKASKKSIYASHRGDFKGAQKLRDTASKSLTSATAIAAKDPQLLTIGALAEAQEEFCEASVFLSFCQGASMPSPQELGVIGDPYLAGVCDVSGELVRLAINSAIKDDYQTTVKVQEFLNELYGELMKFDFRNGPLRRKFDAVKYGLDKVENLLLDLKLKDKV